MVNTEEENEVHSVSRYDKGTNTHTVVKDFEKRLEKGVDKKEEFDGSVQFELDYGDRRIRVNCPDEDNDIYIQVRRGKQYAGMSLSLDEAEQLANYILGHVKNAR